MNMKAPGDLTMSDEDIDYLLRRAVAELEAARTSGVAEAVATHRTLAEAYLQRARALCGESDSATIIRIEEARGMQGGSREAISPPVDEDTALS